MICAEDVYDAIGLPTGLRVHMASTVAVVRLLSAACPDELSLVVREVELAMALHDVGNAVKFDGNSPNATIILREPVNTLPRWQLYTRYMRTRYGEDDHRATEMILRELGVRPDLRALIGRKSSRHMREIVARNEPSEILALYADMRVAPEGIVSIEQRYREANERYANAGRIGLGGTVGLEDLAALEQAVVGTFESSEHYVTSERVATLFEECLTTPLDEAFSVA